MDVKTKLLAACLLATTSLHAQHFQWATAFGEGAGSIGGISTQVDVFGNVYTTGYFYGTVDFDLGPGTVSLTSAGFSDIFVQKMDVFGNFLWAKSFGGTGYDEGSSISVDATGNVYTTGYFYGTVDFDPGATTANFTSAGTNEIFVQKMDASGNFLWAKAFGRGGGGNGHSIYVDASGNVYTTGYFQGTADFDPGAGSANLTSAGGQDIFVQKMDASGNFLWAKAFGGDLNDKGNSIYIDASGNVYSTGVFSGTVDFDPGASMTNITAGYSDIFVQKMDASGNFLWVKAFWGTYSNWGSSIHVDASGNVYTTGFFFGTVDFDPGAGTANLTSPLGGSNVFVQKMDASGNFLWAKTFGGGGSSKGNSIDVDPTGNVYTTGFFTGTVDFDPGAGTVSLNSAGDRDIFVQKMDASGNFLWVKSFGGADSDVGNSVHVDASGNVYTTGFFKGTVDFDPGAGTANLSSTGAGFVLKMSQGPSGIVAIGNGIEVKAYPNPGNGLVQISFEQPLSNVTITVTDLQGSVVYSKQLTTASKEQINIEGSAGVYFLTVTTSEGQSVVKLIKE